MNGRPTLLVDPRGRPQGGDTAPPPPPASPLPPRAERTGPATLRRLVTVTPAMCGPLQSLIACAGDWTWDTVGQLCGLDVNNARTEDGTPSYLAFYYVRLLSGGGTGPQYLGPQQLTFGDRLEVTSRVFDAGRLSVLTVHRLRRLPDASAAAEDAPFEPREFDPHDLDRRGFDPGEFDHRDFDPYDFDPHDFDPSEPYTTPRPDCLYVETLNTWVSRGNGTSNVGLVRRAPVGFRREHLPPLTAGPVDHPAELCRRARNDLVFQDHRTDGWATAWPTTETDHEVDLVTEVNGVGLLYFASFFSIVERALYRQWRDRGRTRRAFAGRAPADLRICYLGNADLDATLRLRMGTLRDPDDAAHEKTDLTIHDLSTDRLIAVASFRHHNCLAE